MVFVTLYSFGTEDLFRNGLCTRANSNFKVAFFLTQSLWQWCFSSIFWQGLVFLRLIWVFTSKSRFFFQKSYVCVVIVHRTNLFTGNWSPLFLPSVFERKTGKMEKYCKQLYWWHLMCQCYMVSKCNSISFFQKISKQMHLMKVWKNVKATKWALTERQ